MAEPRPPARPREHGELLKLLRSTALHPIPVGLGFGEPPFLLLAHPPMREIQADFTLAPLLSGSAVSPLLRLKYVQDMPLSPLVCLLYHFKS